MKTASPVAWLAALALALDGAALPAAAQVADPPPPHEGADLSGAPPAPPPTVPPLPEAARRNRPEKARRPAAEPPQAPEPAPSPERQPFTRDEAGLVKLDFPQAEIADVAKAISELTQKNFLLDERVRGKITIMSPKPVSVDEAYQAFISALEVKGFTVVRIGRIYKIVELRDMKSLPITTETDGESFSSDVFVTRLIPLKYIKAAEIVKSLRGLVSKNGDMISYDPTNTLILTDTQANLRRLLRIIDRLDLQGGEESLEVIRLKYSAASDMADKIRRIFDLQERPPGMAPVPGAPGEGRTEAISKIIPDERTNSLIVLANREGIRRVREVVGKLDQSPEAEISKGKIHVHYLQYADATEMAATLASLTGGSRQGGRRTSRPARRASLGSPSAFTRGPGQPPVPPPMPPELAPPGVPTGALDLFGGEILITADPPTNSLVITASPADYEALLPIIAKLDVRRPQAFIEAMILEVDIDKAFEVGVAGHGGGQVGSTTVFGATNLGSSTSLSVPTDPSALQGVFAGMTGGSVTIPVGAGQTLSLPAYGAAFRALQTSGTINLLSTPNILTSDNMEAEIVVGQIVPFVTAQGRDINNQPINQVQRENVALTLRVTPQINESDDVTLDIFQEIQDLVPGPNEALFGPTTATRSAKSTVLVKDGQTISLGGLIQDREHNSVTKVPVLGDIPIIGWFFKSKKRTKRKQSLVLFLTPHIVRDPEDLEILSVRANEARRRFLKQNYVRENPALQQYDLDRDLRVPPKYDRQPPAETEPPEADPAPEPARSEPEEAAGEP